jgi:hypothetical protein
VLWHELIESTVTDPNSPDNRFILWQRNGAEITIRLLIQSLEQTLCKKYEEIMKTIIFFINILLPKQGLQHLGKNRVFYDKTWLYLCSWVKKTRFLREVFVTLGLAGSNGVFYQKTSLYLRSRVKKTVLEASLCNFWRSYPACKYGNSRSALRVTKNPDSLRSSLELLGNPSSH